jgi:hypothetical protein
MQGAFTHQDFSGRKGTIRTGDVQVNHLLNKSSKHEDYARWILS